ncbi:hypothetical protein P691DRAFT_218658 [Macrolepiota fuliginosa MF-IS2]|uniref:Uncharacterized protein n=1 Tax=Macrolepiota fuliginosa MF-IS2 TaxID=1400762 RepID=A0A9P5XKH6_9AGAR|nr:hypothetical protein P691DRAFT_218658 [Macrolepiota fuliginosa MF-IS2]
MSMQRFSSNTSRHVNDIIEIDPQAFKYGSSKPIIHGWTNGAPHSNPSQPPAPTTPSTQTYPPPHMPPRQQAPLLTSRGQILPPTTPSLSTTSSSSTPAASPVILDTFPSSRHHSTMISSSPSIFPQPPPGYMMDVVPIGPPGKLLPPLTASVMKPLSPSASAKLPSSSTHAPHPLSRPAVTIQGSSTIIDLANTSPVEPQLPSQPSQTQLSVPAYTSQHEPSAEDVQTPRLTPSSSRGSAGPSEGVPEAVTPVTPLDVSAGHVVGVVGSPAVGFGHPHENSAESGPYSVSGGADAEEGKIPNARYGAMLALKRGSSSISGGEGSEEGEIHNPECVRKKPRLGEGVDGSSVNGNAPGVAPPQAMEEDDEEEEEEEEEFGPDGLRTIKYCLDAFTDEDDNGIPACVLCLKRYEEGLIRQPATFPSDTPQETQLKHFLSEHLKVWEDFRNQKTIG